MKHTYIKLFMTLVVISIIGSFYGCQQKKGNNRFKGTRWERISKGVTTGMKIKEVLTFEEDVMYYQMYLYGEMITQKRSHYETNGITIKTDDNAYWYSYTLDAIEDSIEPLDKYKSSVGESCFYCPEYRRDIDYHPSN